MKIWRNLLFMIYFSLIRKKEIGTFSKTNIRTADCYCCYYISSSCEINARINATLAKCYQINRKIYGITDSMIRRAHAASITSFIDGFFTFITNHLYLLSALCRFDTKMKVILITPRSILFFFFYYFHPPRWIRPERWLLKILLDRL